MSKTNSLPARHAAARAEVAQMTLDECVSAHTAMRTLDEIVACTLRDGYRPSLYTKPFGISMHHYRRAELAKRIADAYDWQMMQLGRKERAYRGHDDSPVSLTQSPEPSEVFLTPADLTTPKSRFAREAVV